MKKALSLHRQNVKLIVPLLGCKDDGLIMWVGNVGVKQSYFLMFLFRINLFVSFLCEENFDIGVSLVIPDIAFFHILKSFGLLSFGYCV